MSEATRSEAARSEHGDRSAFLATIRSRQGPPVAAGPHPPPPPPSVIPVMEYRSLDDVDASDPKALLPHFLAALGAAEASAVVIDTIEAVEAELRAIVETHGVERAVVSREPEAAAVAPALRALGVEVAEYDRHTGEAADLSVTSATHGVAATGSLVVDTEHAGSRAVSLLARVHLCVLPADRIVAIPSDVLRSMRRPMPSCRVVITGPSRTGDIEQLLTLGAHGPVALHVLVQV